MEMNLTLPDASREETIDKSNMPYYKMYYWTTSLLAPAAPAILLFGLISNIINIVIFLKAGVKDNVTTLLLSLALSDLVFIALITPSACALVILNFAKSWPWPFDGMFLYFLPYWPAFTAYDLSAFISVALGVMRCACVAMPLKFKVVFTRTRTIRFVLFLVVLAVSLRVPVLTIFRVMHRADPVTNSSVLHVVAVNRKAMSRINDVMNRGVIIWVKYAIMVSCVGILSFKLAQASRIRRSCTETASQAGEKNTKEGLAPKDLQVIKSVVLVCTIFIFSQLPFLLSSTARLITPEYTSNGKMRYLYNSISAISLFCSYLNASLNIFVYYKFNSKYKFVFLSTVTPKTKALKNIRMTT